MGVKGRDFVLLGGDSAFFRSVVIMNSVSPVSQSVSCCLKLSMRTITKYIVQVSATSHKQPRASSSKQRQRQQQQEKEDERFRDLSFRLPALTETASSTTKKRNHTN